MKKCKHCQSEIDNNVKVCPNCGQKQRMPIWLIVVIVIVIIAVIGSLSGGDSEKQKKDTNKNDENVTENTEIESEEPEVSEEDSVPTEYKNALAKAESYSDMMHMSKQGIYDQLTSEYGEQFAADAAQYAIDNIDADWNANALAKAKSYQETMNMSKNAIYDQLTSEYGEKFTAEEAQYAIDHLE